MRPLPRCAVLLVLCTACGRDAGETALDSAVGGPAITIRRTRDVDLTGDRRAERFVVLATGSRYDSLDVTLEIRSPEDSLLYTDSWDSWLYFENDDRSLLTDSVVEHRVRAQIDSILGSTSFRPGGIELTTDERLNREGMRDAIREDVAEEMWRQANRIPIDSSTPPHAGEAIYAMARDSVSDARVESLVAELRDRPTFRYFAGGEATYAIAWSEEERRFVTIWACC
ncbi:MAG TPA: hypothetical protein VJ802_14310 [Gemmatimonadaceae bacterium]|nr:hypothetical protein [Gemmatimonadaceae bacterium]